MARSRLGEEERALKSIKRPVRRIRRIGRRGHRVGARRPARRRPVLRAFTSSCVTTSDGGARKTRRPPRSAWAAAPLPTPGVTPPGASTGTDGARVPTSPLASQGGASECGSEWRRERRSPAAQWPRRRPPTPIDPAPFPHPGSYQPQTFHPRSAVRRGVARAIWEPASGAMLASLRSRRARARLARRDRHVGEEGGMPLSPGGRRGHTSTSTPPGPSGPTVAPPTRVAYSPAGPPRCTPPAWGKADRAPAATARSGRSTLHRG